MPWGVESQAAPGRDPGGTALPSSNKPIPEADGASTALVVLGTHRSGTSALANVLAAAGADPGARPVQGSPGHEIGRAPCRGRVCQYVWMSGGGVAIKKKK